MVTSIDDRHDASRKDPIAHAAQAPEESVAREERKADLYAEAELKLRHERTERFIQKAARELG